MGEGIFLLVIKDLLDDFEVDKKRKIFKRSPNLPQNFIRYTDYINNKPFYIIEVSKNFLLSENMQRLLAAYKGKVLINENIPQEQFLEYLYDSTEYFIRALLSSLLNRIKYEKDIESICIKYNSILICEEIFEIVKSVRNVHFIVNQDIETEIFKNECLKRYGTFVKTGECNCLAGFDIYNDLSEMTPDGKCEIYFKGVRGILYPDSTFFETNDSVKKLLKYGVNKKIACAICNSKKT